MHDDLKNSADVLKSGGIILYPADTGWGIGCDATNEQAVSRLMMAKSDNLKGELVLLMENPALLERYIKEVPEIAWDLVELSSMPLNVIYPGAKNIAPNLPDEDGSIGICITREEFTIKLLQRFRRPVVFMPAIFSESKIIESFELIPDNVKKRVDYVVEYRQNDAGWAKPAGIIRLWPGGRIDILRE